tara:strand:- start:679 stop:1029 length:351 start_codon:yes stop_codon:yes gene_type:complete
MKNKTIVYKSNPNKTVYNHLINGVEMGVPLRLDSSTFIVAWNNETKPFLSTVNHAKHPEKHQVYSYALNLQKSHKITFTICFKNLDDAKKELKKQVKKWDKKYIIPTTIKYPYLTI